MRDLEGRIGLALGSGAARGWAHIGVIRELLARGIRPDVVCGSSIGAVVGAAYASGRLDALESWGRQLDRRQVVSFLDVSLRGGVIRARRVTEAFASHVPDRPIQGLERAYAATATDLETGRELWLRDGSLLEAVRASVGIPGFVVPVQRDGRWVVDGGLVNPVPISLCRALGADSVIAVDLNTTLLQRRFGADPILAASLPEPPTVEAAVAAAASGDAADAAPPEPGSLRTLWSDFLGDARRRLAWEEGEPREAPPSIFDVVSNSVNIMQVRITRSRMAGDPPELLVSPRLGDFAMLDFHRADEAIEEGRRAVERALAPAHADDPPAAADGAGGSHVQARR